MATKHTQNIRRLGHLAIFTGLACAALGASADDPFKMQVDPTAVPGNWGINNEHYNRAIRLLEIVIARAKRTARAQNLLLTNLCVAYTKVVNYETATRYFDQAIEWNCQAGGAYNNRGVLEALKYNFVAAASDFDAARNRRESIASAEHNIDRLGKQVSELSGDSPPHTLTKPNI